MSKRYIDADAIRKTVEELINEAKLQLESVGDNIACRFAYTSRIAERSYLLHLINWQPTADVVEVVRCRDCKYWQDNNGGYPHEKCAWRDDETPDDDDYCSYGERIEENENNI